MSSVLERGGMFHHDDGSEMSLPFPIDRVFSIKLEIGRLTLVAACFRALVPCSAPFAKPNYLTFEIFDEETNHLTFTGRRTLLKLEEIAV